MKKSKGSICPQCGGWMQGRHGQTMCVKCSRKEYLREYLARGEEPQPDRLCHDCGRPTFDYRCEECRQLKEADCADFTGYRIGA